MSIFQTKKRSEFIEFLDKQNVALFDDSQLSRHVWLVGRILPSNKFTNGICIQVLELPNSIKFENRTDSQWVPDRNTHLPVSYFCSNNSAFHPSDDIGMIGRAVRFQVTISGDTQSPTAFNVIPGTLLNLDFKVPGTDIQLTPFQQKNFFNVSHSLPFADCRFEDQLSIDLLGDVFTSAPMLDRATYNLQQAASITLTTGSDAHLPPRVLVITQTKNSLVIPNQS